MAQATYVPDIAHEKAEAFAFFSAVFQAIATNNAGATAPTETFPGMWWWDTSTTPPTLRQRNAANSAWVAFEPPRLTQAQVEDDASTVFGMVSGQRLAQQLAAKVPDLLASRAYNVQEFLSSGTWTKPANAESGDRVVVFGVGAGGAGAKDPDSNDAGGGSGGYGGYCRFQDIDDLAATEPVTIGAGASGRTSNGSGGNGGWTSFGAANTPARVSFGGGGGGQTNRGASALAVFSRYVDAASGNSSSTEGSEGVGGYFGSPFGNSQPGGSRLGGGGGAGHSLVSTSGGPSLVGGHGGRNGFGSNNAINGQFPGGGGGGSAAGNSGAGANGYLIVLCIRE